ncbi:hypothetical protein SKAU_G00403860 [Synaphobranchus kaupii]|uniref:Uncharacterized protein n=1 Tax=Synaphobranchus kaupii TaxID=118154 RepID=A0A9Q1E9P5_SYNKA|nr:hypothetical protein SKAU_G00403860 [Synaphobranchus kaupii]
MKPAMGVPCSPAAGSGTARYLSNPEQRIRVFANAAVKSGLRSNQRPSFDGTRLENPPLLFRSMRPNVMAASIIAMETGILGACVPMATGGEAEARAGLSSDLPE